jgi:phosphocarrier protein HPr
LYSKEVKIANKYGLHARPSAQLVKTASFFKSDIFLEKDGLKVNGKSIMGVMMLAAEYDSTVIIAADGEDEVDAVETLYKLMKSQFEEAYDG